MYPNTPDQNPDVVGPYPPVPGAYPAPPVYPGYPGANGEAPVYPSAYPAPPAYPGYPAGNGEAPVYPAQTTTLSPIWQERFDFFRRYGSPGSSSKETRQALRALGFWKNYRISQNFLAFLFGPIYFAIKGMWRQALTFLAIWAGIAAVLALVGASNGVFRAAGFGLAFLYSITANYAYFRHVNGEESWNPFAGLWSKAR